MRSNKVYLYGKHPLREALMHKPRAVGRVFLAREMEDRGLRDLVREAGIPIADLSASAERNVPSDAAYQGVIAEVFVSELVQPFEQFLSGLEVGGDTALVLLAEVQDPHNVGAVIRSAAAFGIGGVLIPEHKQAPITGAVLKVSAGMAFRVPLVSIGNVNQAMRVLKERGFWTYGLAGEARAVPLPEEKFDGPALFVLGNEAAGIREKTRELCDILLAIPMHPRTESLNAAAAAAVALYAWSTKHPVALRV